MQGWLTWLFISNQVHYWTDIMQTKSQKSAKKKEVKKKAKEQKKAIQENESDNETPLVNGKEKVQWVLSFMLTPNHWTLKIFIKASTLWAHSKIFLWKNHSLAVTHKYKFFIANKYRYIDQWTEECNAWWDKLSVNRSRNASGHCLFTSPEAWGSVCPPSKTSQNIERFKGFFQKFFVCLSQKKSWVHWTQVNCDQLRSIAL